MEVISPSLTIKALSDDGNIYNFIILFKSKVLHNSSKFLLPLPRKVEKQDLFKRGNLGINQDFLFYLQKMMIYYSKYFYAKNCGVLRRSLVAVPKLVEFGGQEIYPIEDVNVHEIQEEKEGENDNEGENILENNRIMKMMKNMGYKKGKGLGVESEGPPSFVLDYEIRSQKDTYGIGYRSTEFDDIEQKKMRIAKAQAKKENVPFEAPMRPYPLTLNGQFTRAGDTCPYWGFRERVIIPTGWDI